MFAGRCWLTNPLLGNLEMRMQLSRYRFLLRADSFLQTDIVSTGWMTHTMMVMNRILLLGLWPSPCMDAMHVPRERARYKNKMSATCSAGHHKSTNSTGLVCRKGMPSGREELDSATERLEEDKEKERYPIPQAAPCQTRTGKLAQKKDQKIVRWLRERASTTSKHSVLPLGQPPHVVPLMLLPLGGILCLLGLSTGHGRPVASVLFRVGFGFGGGWWAGKVWYVLGSPKVTDQNGRNGTSLWRREGGRGESCSTAMAIQSDESPKSDARLTHGVP